ncbi:hypothetical protein GEMRC1_008533 [Eukaryota sp. GEM-RC1]
MSQVSHSTTGFGSKESKGIQSWIQHLLSGVAFLHASEKIPHKVCSYTLLIVQFIQILGFVLRETVFHPLLDLQHILKYVSLPIHSSWATVSGPALLLSLFLYPSGTPPTAMLMAPLSCFSGSLDVILPLLCSLWATVPPHWNLY